MIKDVHINKPATLSAGEWNIEHGRPGLFQFRDGDGRGRVVDFGCLLGDIVNGSFQP